MIVRPLPHGAVLLITQPDHAALAARLMRAWRGEGLHESGRRADILIAIEEHDNGWREADAAPLLDPASGAILDFMTAPDAVRRGVWPRGVGRLAGTPYAAALVAQHALHIYRRYRDDDSWRGFFTDMEKLREHYLAAAGLRSHDELKRDYGFVRLGDLASLVFCNAWRDPHSDDAGSGHSIHLAGDTLVVSPDPFGGKQVPLEIAGRELPAAAFASADQARRAWAEAPAVTLRGIASGA